MISVRLPAQHIALIDMVAAKDDRSRSDAVREAVKDWLMGMGLLKSPPESKKNGR